MTLPEEPDRGGQICGEQITTATWTSRASYCGERKVVGLYFCQEHHDWLVLDEPDGVIRMAPGNAIGVAGEEPTLVRPVPRESGEAAIYSPERLAHHEGNAHGTDPTGWRGNVG